MWTKSDFTAELSRSPRAKLVSGECWEIQLTKRIGYEHGYVFTAVDQDGLVPWAGCSPQYVREGMRMDPSDIIKLITGEIEDFNTIVIRGHST